MRIGFTGTRAGMTQAQANTTIAALLWLTAHEEARPIAVHGDCKGADAQFDSICKTYGFYRIAWPCTLHNQRAFCDVNEQHVEQPPLVRNRCIVEDANVMLATPRSATEELRSGTWATIRHARRAGKPLLLILPDGTVR